ncbi:gliding motility lipoprotein GldB, partial [Pseudoxanthomonas sp. SGD-10]
TPENITPRVVEVIAREDLFPEEEKDQSLLSKMIYNGKLMQFMKSVQPNLADSTVLGYDSKQMQWAQQFEGDIWAYFLEEDLLYNTDYLKIQKYLAEAPFTPGLGAHNDSAPKLGIFSGWQIVKAYMKNNPEITLQELMSEKDEQKILKGAKYRP